MPLVINAKTYTADSIEKDAITYVGPASTVSVIDSMMLRRSRPKPTATNSGIAKAFVKAMQTVTLTGAVTPTSVVSANVDVAVPVGMADAAVDAFCTDLGSYIASANFKTQVKKQTISF